MDYIELGKKIYNMENPREVKRCVVFVVRCLLNNGRMKKLHQFFTKNELLAKIAEEYPFVYEQPTRAFFYNKSTFDERAKILEQHMGFMEKYFKKDVFLGLYGEKPYTLWERMKSEVCALSFPSIQGNGKKDFFPLYCTWMMSCFTGSCSGYRQIKKETCRSGLVRCRGQM